MDIPRPPRSVGVQVDAPADIHWLNAALSASRSAFGVRSPWMGCTKEKILELTEKKKIVMGGSDAWACRSYSYGL